MAKTIGLILVIIGIIILGSVVFNTHVVTHGLITSFTPVIGIKLDTCFCFMLIIIDGILVFPLLTGFLDPWPAG